MMVHEDDGEGNIFCKSFVKAWILYEKIVDQSYFSDKFHTKMFGDKNQFVCFRKNQELLNRFECDVHWCLLYDL